MQTDSSTDMVMERSWRERTASPKRAGGRVSFRASQGQALRRSNAVCSLLAPPAAAFPTALRQRPITARPPPKHDAAINARIHRPSTRMAAPVSAARNRALYDPGLCPPLLAHLANPLNSPPVFIDVEGLVSGTSLSLFHHRLRIPFRSRYALLYSIVLIPVVLLGFSGSPLAFPRPIATTTTIFLHKSKLAIQPSSPWPPTASPAAS